MQEKLSPLVLKRASITETGEFSGYASTWHKEPDAVGDIIEKGAFAEAIAYHERNGTMPGLLWGHDHKEPVGRWLKFIEDEHGLLGIGKLSLGTTRGKEAHTLLKDNALSLSIGFTIKSGGSVTKNGIRIIKNVSRLHEVSLVSVPANGHAKITGVKASPRNFEKALRVTLGLSAREAKRVTATGWQGLVRDGRDDLDHVLMKIDELKSQLEIEVMQL